MTAQTRVQPRGLVTEPSRLIAGDGGLLRAQNVICRAPGLIEPRPSLRAIPNAAAASSGHQESYHSREWDTLTVTACANSGGTEMRLVRDNETDPLITLATTGTQRSIYSEVADGRSMWAFTNGLRMLDQSNQAKAQTWSALASADQVGIGAFARMPGAPRPWMHVLLSGGVGLAAGETCAYRATIVRWVTDDAGRRVPVESPPSDRYVVRNNTAGNRGVRINIGVECWPLWWQVRVGDEVRFYRTASNGAASADPGDEMILRKSFQITSSMLTGLTFSLLWYDDLAANEYGGPALYTNESQEGSTRANYRLRTAADLATYQGKLFYAGGSAGWRKSTIIKRIGGLPTGAFASDTNDSSFASIYSVTNVTWTNGSAVITGVPAAMFPYLSVGQLITYQNTLSIASSTTNGLPGATIVSFNSGAGTITMSAPATANGNAPITAWDWIGFSDSTGATRRVYFPYVTAAAPGTLNDPGLGLGNPMYGPTPLLTNVATEIMPIESAYMNVDSGYGPAQIPTAPSAPLIPRMYSETGPSSTRDITITIEWDASFASRFSPDTLDLSAAPRIAITSSKPDATSERLWPTYAESRPADHDGDVATLWWSKQNQPECVPLGNFAVIGDSSEPIVRIFGTTDRLWVLKTDGLWCVYGAGDTPDALTIQPVDTTFRMMATPDCSAWACKIRDTVYAWTQFGIYAIDSRGPQRIDEDIASLVRSLTPGFDPTQSQSFVAGRPFCSASVRDQVVVFGAHQNTAGTVAGYCLVYCVDGGTWSTWDGVYIPSALFPTYAGGYGTSESGALRLAFQSGYITLTDVPAWNKANTANDVPLTGDVFQYTPALPNVTSVVGKVVTLNIPYPVGSRIRDSAGLWFRLVSLAGANYTVDLAGVTAGLATEVHIAAPHVVTFAANQSPSTEKHALTQWHHWQRIRGGTRFSIDWRARGHASGEAPQDVVVYDDPEVAGYPASIPADLEYDYAVSVPTATSRVRGLEVTVTQAEADVYFAIDGLTIETSDETPRIEKRR